MAFISSSRYGCARTEPCPNTMRLRVRDVRAFHRDGDRHRAIKTAHIVLRSIDDGLAAVHIHRVINRNPQPLGSMQLHDAGGSLAG